MKLYIKKKELITWVPWFLMSAEAWFEDTSVDSSKEKIWKQDKLNNTRMKKIT
jgi:hypothetical protein